MTHAPHRTRMPESRRGITRKATICGFECYITVNFFDDGTTGDNVNEPGEVFVKISKHGTELSGLMDTAATFLSMALQYGVPWPILRDKMLHTKFGTPDAEFSSLCDGIAKLIDRTIAERAKMLGLDETETDDEG